MRRIDRNWLGERIDHIGVNNLAGRYDPMTGGG